MKKSEEATRQLQSIQTRMDEVGPAYEAGSRKAWQEMKSLSEEFKHVFQQRETLKKQEGKG